MLVSFYVSYGALWILVVLHSLVLLGLVRAAYQLQQTSADPSRASVRRNGRLQPGDDVPEFSTVDLFGARVNSTDFAGNLRALLFVSPSCGTCTTTLSEMRALDYKARSRLTVICRAGREDCLGLAKRYEIQVPTVADEDDQISRLFGISAVPTAVLIDASDRIQTYGNPLRGEELEKMLEKEPTQEAESLVHG